MPTKCTVLDLPKHDARHQGGRRTRAAASGRPSARAARPPSASGAPGRRAQRSSVDARGQRLAGQVLLLDHARRARRLAAPAALTRWWSSAACAKGTSTAALPAAVSSAQVVAPLRAHDQVGGREARLHVVEERDAPRPRGPPARRRPRSPSRMAAPVWWTMRRRSGPGRCGSASTSARFRTREPWLPPKTSSVWGRPCALPGQAREAAAHRVAGEHALGAELAPRLLVGAGGAAHEGLQHAVGEAGLRVRLQDHGGHPQRGRGQHERPARVAADAEHRLRLQPRDQRHRLRTSAQGRATSPFASAQRARRR